MGKAKKLSPALKTKITKMFKAGKDVKEIKLAVIGDFPKITPDRVKNVIRKHLFGLCDDLWSEAVKVRDGGKCVISGKRDNLNSHHLIGRNNRFYRWVVKNGVTLAPDHHTLGHNISAHGSTDVTQRFAEWMAENREEQWAWFNISKDLIPPYKPNIEDLLTISKALQNEIDCLHLMVKRDRFGRKKLGQ